MKLYLFFSIVIIFISCRQSPQRQIEKHNRLNFDTDYGLKTPKLNFTAEGLNYICSQIKKDKIKHFPYFNIAPSLYLHPYDEFVKDTLKFSAFTQWIHFSLIISLNESYQDSIQLYVNNKKKQAEFYEYEILLSDDDFTNGYNHKQKYYIRNGNIIEYKGLYYLIYINKMNFKRTISFYNKHYKYIIEKENIFGSVPTYEIGNFIMLMPSKLPNNCFCTDKKIKH